MTENPLGAFQAEAWGDGSAFLVKAHPGARRDGLSGIHDGMLKVEVAVAPEKGKANKAIVRLLATRLGVAPGKITILSGETNARKRLAVFGLTPDEVAERVERALLESGKAR